MQFHFEHKISMYGRTLKIFENSNILANEFVKTWHFWISINLTASINEKTGNLMHFPNFYKMYEAILEINHKGTKIQVAMTENFY